MHSPLKDLNKTSAISHIKETIKNNSSIDTYCFYTGDCEFILSETEHTVNSYTNSYVVYEFWRSMLDEPERVYELVTSPDFNFDSEEYFNVLQERWYTYRNRYLRSALFFLLNRCSSTGLVSSGQIDQTNFTPFAINTIKNFKKPTNFSLDFIKKPQTELSTFINLETTSDYIYIPAGDFSYNLFEDGKSYGPEQTRVNNRELKNMLSTDKKILLHYNFHNAAPNFFKKYNVTMIDKYGKITYNKENAQEVVVANF